MPRQPRYQPPPPHGYAIEQDYRQQPGCATGCAFAILRTHQLVWRLAWRYRDMLKPLGVAAGVLVVTLAVRTAYGYRWTWQPLTILAVLSAAAAVGLWFGGQYLRLDRAPERAYAAGVALASGVWAEVAYYRGPLYPPMLGWLLLATLAGGAPWWWHRRIRRKREDPIKQATADWAELAPKLDLDGVEIVGLHVSRDGQRWTIAFLMPRTMTAHEFRQKVREGKLDVAFDLRRRACRVEEVPGRARRVNVHITPGDDPHAAALKPPPLPKVVSVLDPVPLAVDEYGHEVAVRTHDRHGLLGASTGGGKSSVIHNIMRVWGRAADGLVCGIDMGGGSTLGAWRNRIPRMTTGARTGADLLAWGVQVMEQRLAGLGEGEDDALRVSPHQPALKFIIDEYDELVEQEPKAAEHVDTIVRRGRKAAVTVLLTSLRPTKEALGGTALRQQLALRVLLPVLEVRDADLIIGEKRRAAGWDPLLLDEPGKMLIFAPPEHSRPRPYKGYWVSKKDAIALDAEYAATYPLPRLEGAASLPAGPAQSPAAGLPSGLPASPSRSRLLGLPAGPPPAHPPSPGASPPAGPLVSPPPSPPDAAGERAPMAALLAALQAAGESGAKVAELAEATGMRGTWVYDRLGELVAEGKVARGPHSRWIWQQPTEEGGLQTR
jgi:S-DNA-T family DNA segregation ATPase FtsK/SpoIIIE